MLKETLVRMWEFLLKSSIESFLVILPIALMAVVAYCGVMIFTKLRNKIRGSSFCPIRNEVEQNHEIYNQLVALRAVTNSDRVYVARFHNGVDFLPSHPAWKISKTHEVVRNGVTYESTHMQNLLVSLIPDLIGAIITGSVSMSGVRVYNCDGCPFKQRCLVENRRVVVLNVEEMQCCFLKYHLSSQNIKTAIICGIANGGNVYGYIGADFCGTALTTEEADAVVKSLCGATEQIQFQLSFRKLIEDKI